ncbi:MAG: hypothetical protein ACKO3P_08560, partial [Planctomycetaceae bacterium]
MAAHTLLAVPRDAGEARISDQVLHFVGIEQQIIELLGGGGPFAPARVQQHVLARAVVDVGQHRAERLEAADVLVAARAHRPLRLIG